MNIETELTNKLKSLLNDQQLPLHEPYFNGNEDKYVNDCIKSTFVSTIGKYVDELEKKLAEFTGAKRAVAVVNGTTAIQIALKVSGVKPEEEVLIPTLTFIGTANAVHHHGASIHFVDSENETLGIDPYALRAWLKEIGDMTSSGLINRKTKKRIKALLPVHIYGNPCKIEELQSIASEFKLILIEDSAESLGSYCKNKHTGTFGLCGTLSFNGNKIITTGGGGAILTDNDELADYAKHITTTAKKKHPFKYLHDEVGFNFRLPNINAAIGCAQLEQIEMFLKAKRNLTKKYHELFSKIPGIRLLLEAEGNSSNYWLQTIILDDNLVDKQDDILIALNNAGIFARPAWQLLHKSIPYKNCFRAPLSNVEKLERKLINLPSSVKLGI